jgi:hypothetical protein
MMATPQSDPTKEAVSLAHITESLLALVLTTTAMAQPLIVALSEKQSHGSQPLAVVLASVFKVVNVLVLDLRSAVEALGMPMEGIWVARTVEVVRVQTWVVILSTPATQVSKAAISHIYSDLSGSLLLASNRAQFSSG